jgi:hypothetical protein
VLGSTDLILISVGGIQRGAAGVRVTEEGIYRDVGIVYYSDLASANILSFASQIDAGADISYDKANDRFVMTPVHLLFWKEGRHWERRKVLCVRYEDYDREQRRR